MIALGIIHDGRLDYLHRTVESAIEKMDGLFTHRFIVDDTGTDESGAYLKEHFPYWMICHHDTRRGLAGAVWTCWQTATDLGADHLFHLEDDFTMNVDIDVQGMCDLLDTFDHLSQLVLKRQPWSPEEIQAGGQIETAPELYTEETDGSSFWVEHRRLFSFNPCLIPRSTFAREWGPILEADVTAVLNLSPLNQFAYWGKRDAPPLCTHIGAVRSAGYRW